MPPKGAKPTSDELLAQFDDLGIEQSGDKSTKPAATAATDDSAKGEQEDVLAELEKQASQRPSSGPGTPRLSADKARSATKSPRLSATIERSSEDKTRLSAEAPHVSAKQEQQKQEPEPTAAQQQEQSQGGGWWGGFFAVAGAAVKQAEAAVKEIQNNEEAQRWAQQVKGNVGALRDFGIYALVPLDPSYTYGYTN
jgi:uncharacterized phage infection (PIP) family protein YhgE